MAFTRKALKAMGLSDEQIDSLIELHTETIDAIKADRDKYKDDAEKLSDVQRQLDEANSKIEAAEKDDYKGKYESTKAEYDKYKEEVATKETKAKKSGALKAALKEKGYSEFAIDKITKHGGYGDSIELDEDGKIKDSDTLFDKISKEWGGFKPEVKVDAHSPADVHQVKDTKPKSEIAARMAKFNDKYNFDHYGIKPSVNNTGNTNNSAKEE